MIDRLLIRPLLRIVEAAAALLLAADLLVVSYSVLCRYVFNAPLEWADDVARGLMVATELLRRRRAHWRIARMSASPSSSTACRPPPAASVGAVAALLVFITAASVAV